MDDKGFPGMLDTKRVSERAEGPTVLEVVLILVGFLAISTVITFVILTAAAAYVEQTKPVAKNHAQDASSPMLVNGSIMASGANGNVSDVSFNLSLASGADPVDLSSSVADAKVVIGFHDASQTLNNLEWTLSWIGRNDGDNVLEAGEVAGLTVDVSGASLSAHTAFTLEIKTPTGVILPLNRTTPDSIEAVMDLH